MDATRQNMQSLEEALFFKLRKTKQKQQKNKEKQTIQLILCQLDVGDWRKEKGSRLTDVIKKMAFFFSLSFSLLLLYLA